MESPASVTGTGDLVSSTNKSIVHGESNLTLDAFPDLSTNSASDPVVPHFMRTGVARANPSDIFNAHQSEEHQNEKSSWHEKDTWIFIRSFTPL
jgi:hypothetical protein